MLRYKLLACFAVCCLTFNVSAQLLTWTPQFIKQENTTTAIEITADANLGNSGLKDYTPTSDVYVHIGCITTASTSATDWKYSKFSWGTTNTAAACTFLGNNKWKFIINGGLRNFFGITNANERILKIAILFRNGNGSRVLRNADGSDMYVPVYENNLAVTLTSPLRQPTYLPQLQNVNYAIGNSLTVSATASDNANLKLLYNGAEINNLTNVSTISSTLTITAAGNQQIIAQAIQGSVTVSDTISFFVAPTVIVEDPPAGLKPGINYDAGDTSVHLLLYAPLKNSVAVVGDFNNWTQTATHQMKRSVDGNWFWVRITGLTPATEYAYQFIIDGNLQIADYNTEKVLDPWNDQFIPATTYPNLKPYPTGKTSGIVSILQTRKPVYNWTAGNYTRPAKTNLVIYELLVRDFVAGKNWNTIRDTLQYLKKLGVNAIEFMPFNEFEGNISWGYNPSFYFAPDKYYGTELALKALIDSCHKMGIAVIMDIALNHSFGQNPMVQMYWDAANNKPAANSPWFNPDAKHPFNVGYDFNHESQATKDFVDRVIEHWLVNYKIDGFRWDLSKGFTQVNNPNNVAAWGNYDISRVNIWKRIYNKMQSVVPGSYCILEHFADNTEEKELADYGMLLWGNLNYAFNQATMGFSSDWNFQWGIHTVRNWNNPHLITYQESHDEERLMYKNLKFGNTNNAAYNVRDLSVALKRNEMATAFWAMIPGPKMLWQFGEMGYDYSINTCDDGVTVNDNCRLSVKPIRWDYSQNTDRKKLQTVYTKLLNFKINPVYTSTFTSNNINYNLGTAIKWLSINDDSLKIMVVGNFDVTTQSATIFFPTVGTWYSYLTGTSINVSNTAYNITLQPGEYYVYTNKQAIGSAPPATVVTPPPPSTTDPVLEDMRVKIYPNPIQPTTIIEYDVLEPANVEIELFNSNGKKVANLLRSTKPKGRHTLLLNTSAYNIYSMNTGMFFIQININGKKRIEKCVKL